MNIDSSPEDTPHLQQSGWPCRASYRHQEWGASLFTLQRTLQSSISGVSMGFQIADKLLLHRISCLWQGLAVNAVQSQAWHLLSRYVCLAVWTIPFLSRKKGQGRPLPHLQIGIGCLFGIQGNWISFLTVFEVV